ncbi:lamin tail domain-containing protein, partial [Myxococcota bacterium]|nr:lamin tail domain-containing protein [Myxococcota bacterium]
MSQRRARPPIPLVGPFVVRLVVPLVALLLILVTLFAGAPACAQVVIRQLYGGNGNVYRQDYVELFNRGGAAVSLTGWSLQYASATGTGLFSGAAPSVLSGTLAAGQSVLVGFAASAGGASLPTPFLAGNPATNLSSTSGKLALVRSTAGLACNGGSSPCGP